MAFYEFYENVTFIFTEAYVDFAFHILSVIQWNPISHVLSCFIAPDSSDLPQAIHSLGNDIFAYDKCVFVYRYRDIFL